MQTNGGKNPTTATAVGMGNIVNGFYLMYAFIKA